MKLARMYTTNVINIQRVGRGHIARRGKVRQMLQANHASRVITRAICAHIMKKVRRAYTGSGGARFKTSWLTPAYRARVAIILDTCRVLISPLNGIIVDMTTYLASTVLLKVQL